LPEASASDRKSNSRQRARSQQKHDSFMHRLSMGQLEDCDIDRLSSVPQSARSVDPTPRPHEDWCPSLCCDGQASTEEFSRQRRLFESPLSARGPRRASSRDGYMRRGGGYGPGGRNAAGAGSQREARAALEASDNEDQLTPLQMSAVGGYVKAGASARGGPHNRGALSNLD
jgi:hypothetical protein